MFGFGDGRRFHLRELVEEVLEGASDDFGIDELIAAGEHHQDGHVLLKGEREDALISGDDPFCRDMQSSQWVALEDVGAGVVQDEVDIGEGCEGDLESFLKSGEVVMSGIRM